MFVIPNHLATLKEEHKILKVHTPHEHEHKTQDIHGKSFQVKSHQQKDSHNCINKKQCPSTINLCCNPTQSIDNNIQPLNKSISPLRTMHQTTLAYSTCTINYISRSHGILTI